MKRIAILTLPAILVLLLTPFAHTMEEEVTTKKPSIFGKLKEGFKEAGKNIKESAKGKKSSEEQKSIEEEKAKARLEKERQEQEKAAKEKRAKEEKVEQKREKEEKVRREKEEQKAQKREKKEQEKQMTAAEEKEYKIYQQLWHCLSKSEYKGNRPECIKEILKHIATEKFTQRLVKFKNLTDAVPVAVTDFKSGAKILDGNIKKLKEKLTGADGLLVNIDRAKDALDQAKQLKIVQATSTLKTALHGASSFGYKQTLGDANNLLLGAALIIKGVKDILKASDEIFDQESVKIVLKLFTNIEDILLSVSKNVALLAEFKGNDLGTVTVKNAANVIKHMNNIPKLVKTLAENGKELKLSISKAEDIVKRIADTITKTQNDFQHLADKLLEPVIAEIGAKQMPKNLKELKPVITAVLNNAFEAPNMVKDRLKELVRKPLDDLTALSNDLIAQIQNVIQDILLDYQAFDKDVQVQILPSASAELLLRVHLLLENLKGAIVYLRKKIL